jgi:predicted homoserine dehydrogenase-like protein
MTECLDRASNIVIFKGILLCTRAGSRDLSSYDGVQLANHGVVDFAAGEGLAAGVVSALDLASARRID